MIYLRRPHFCPCTMALMLWYQTTTPVMNSHERFKLVDAPLNPGWPSSVANNLTDGPNTALDWNRDGAVNSQDYGDFILDFFDAIYDPVWQRFEDGTQVNRNCKGDYNHDGQTTDADFTAFDRDFSRREDNP